MKNIIIAQFSIFNIKNSHLLFRNTVTCRTGIWKYFSFKSENENSLGLRHRFLILDFAAEYFTNFWINYWFKHQDTYISNFVFQTSLHKTIGHTMPLCLHGAEWPFLRENMCSPFYNGSINSLCHVSLIIILTQVLFILYLVIFYHFIQLIYLLSVSSWSL